MTRIIAQQTAELDHVNIFNIANFLRIYGNSSFGCSLFSSHGYPPRHGLFALAINVSIAACSTFAVVSPTLPRGQMLYPAKQCDDY
jgi:hypothetical protein